MGTWSLGGAAVAILVFASAVLILVLVFAFIGVASLFLGERGQRQANTVLRQTTRALETVVPYQRRRTVRRQRQRTADQTRRG